MFSYLGTNKPDLPHCTTKPPATGWSLLSGHPTALEAPSSPPWGCTYSDSAWAANLVLNTGYGHHLKWPSGIVKQLLLSRHIWAKLYIFPMQGDILLLIHDSGSQYLQDAHWDYEWHPATWQLGREQSCSLIYLVKTQIFTPKLNWAATTLYQLVIPLSKERREMDFFLFSLLVKRLKAI